MRSKQLAIVLAVPIMILSAATASATTINTVGNQTAVIYTNADSTVDLGDFNLANEPVGITALFGESAVSGSLTFGVFSDPFAPSAQGSVDVNLIAFDPTADIFSASFDGVPLTFTQVDNDFVATFSTNFTDISDIADFVLTFEGFDPGDQFQVNVASVAPIPLPASLPLLLGALGGLGYLSSRRRQNAIA